MAGGDNHAKDIVIQQAEALAKKLQNRNGGCPETQGQAIELITKMIIPLYEARFVTESECLNNTEKMTRIIDKIKAAKSVKSSRIKIGPVEVEGPMVYIINCVPVIFGVLFIVGKLKQWW